MRIGKLRIEWGEKKERPTDGIHARAGTFRLPQSLINDHPKIAMEIMAKCIVYRAESLYYERHVEYGALSREFEPVPEGEVPPEYEWYVDSETGERKAALSRRELAKRIAPDPTPMFKHEN